MKKSQKQQNGKKSPAKMAKNSNGQRKQASVAAAYATGNLGVAPRFTQTKDSIRVQHRELVTSVTGSTAFTVASTIALNPGIAASFPWLSTIANSWEEYSFNKLRFEYLTRTGSTTPGSMIIGPDYDASDAAPVSEQQICAYEDTVEDAPWKDIECRLPANRLNSADKFRFTRSGPLAANQDIKLYDAGNVFVCCVDGTAVNWGKLWVEYDVTFRIPQLDVGSSPSASASGGSFAGGGTITAANPLGTVPVPDAQNANVVLDNASVLTFQALGDYVVAIRLSGTITAALWSTAGAGVTIISQLLETDGLTDGIGYAFVRVNSLVGSTLSLALNPGDAPVTSILGVGQAPSGSL